MKPKQVFFAMIGVVALLVFAVFISLFEAKKTITSQSDKLYSLKLEERVLDEQRGLLTLAAKDVEKYTDLENIARAIVPQDKDQAKAVREIVEISNVSGVKLGAISFQASTLGQKTPLSSASSSTAKQNTTSITQVKPVENIPGVYYMEVNIQQDANSPVTYARMIDFLRRLEQNRRTAHVVNVTVQPDPQNRSLLTFNLVANIYIKP